MRNAPAAGVKVIIVRMWDVIIESISFQEPRYHQRVSKKNPAGVHAHVASLYATQTTRGRAHETADTINGLVDDVHVREFPEELASGCHDGLHDQRVVNLVDVVLVHQNGVQGVRAGS